MNALLLFICCGCFENRTDPFFFCSFFDNCIKTRVFSFSIHVYFHIVYSTYFTFLQPIGEDVCYYRTPHGKSSGGGGGSQGVNAKSMYALSFVYTFQSDGDNVYFAYNYPYFMKLNLREACHLIELRTIPQGHIDYRRVAQNMYNQINKVHPNLSKIMKFVDLKEYDLERFEAEKRTEEKRKKIKK